jgi:hypothetical protein
MIVAPLLGARELAIARSVLYAALFDYPLSLAQLRQTLIESEQTASQIVATYEGSEALQAIVRYRDGLFFPVGRDALVAERRQREERSRLFLRKHRALLACVCALPYVRMVALSGSIAHLNLERDGDLDLFIVTRGRRAWSVTVAVVVLSKIFGSRRVVCANYTVADSRLEFDQQDLFTASQIIHLRPLIGGDVFRQMLAANAFVYRFYPNFHETARDAQAFRVPRLLLRVKAAIETLSAVPSALVERLCHKTYRWHLMRRSASWRSPEQVLLRPDCLKLHTRSHRSTVLDRFERSVEEAIRQAARAIPWAALRR